MLSERTHEFEPSTGETNSTQISLLTIVVYCLILEGVVSEMDEEWRCET